MGKVWIAIDETEISFDKYFYLHEPLRSLEQVTAEVLALEAETDGLFKALVNFVGDSK